MENDVCSLLLRNTLNEITDACPDVKSIFLFREDGDIITGEKTQEESAVHTVDVLDEILEKANVLGGLENVTFEGTKGTVHVSHLKDFYLVTVVPEKADMKHVNMFTGILVPTVLKLIEKTTPAINKKSPSKPENQEPNQPFVKRVEKPVTKPVEKPAAKPVDSPSVRPVDKPAIKLMDKPSVKPDEKSSKDIIDSREQHRAAEALPKKVLPEPQVSQLIVENVQGLFASVDTVRIDGDRLTRWMELYEDKRIEEVMIDSFGGKRVRCRVKPLKDWRLEGKGVIQIPLRIQEGLGVRKGELVRVRPVIG